MKNLFLATTSGLALLIASGGNAQNTMDHSRDPINPMVINPPPASSSTGQGEAVENPKESTAPHQHKASDSTMSSGDPYHHEQYGQPESTPASYGGDHEYVNPTSNPMDDRLYQMTPGPKRKKWDTAPEKQQAAE